MAIVVTGYVPLPCGHRSHNDYMALGGRLVSACNDAIVFRSSLETCWLYGELRDQGLDVAPGGKDTPAYYCVQHQKSAWLLMASKLRESGTLVWIDFGVLHLAGVTTEHVHQLLRAVDARQPEVITSPSCGLRDVPAGCVNWTFCGGVLLMPAHDAAWFHAACVAARLGQPPTWEVNTWNEVFRRHPHRFGFYAANHDASLFTGYQPA